MYEIITEDIYKDLYGTEETKNLFDNSEYSEDNEHFFKEKQVVYQLWNLLVCELSCTVI